MIGVDWSECYVCLCGQVMSTRRSGVMHEAVCEVCQAELAKDKEQRE